MELCADGRKARKSLKTDRLATAFTLAGDEWKAHQRATLAEDKKRKFDRLSSDPTIGELFASWLKTLPPLKRPYHETKWGAVGPFWRARLVTEVTPQLFRDYFQQRRRASTQFDKPPSNGTLKKDAILLRLILKHAMEHGHLAQLPTIPSPGEIIPNPRPWLTHQEWERLKAASLKRIGEASKNPRLQQQRIDLHEQMEWMVATMMRVDEMLDVRFRDCRVETRTEKRIVEKKDGTQVEKDVKDRFLICHVEGKRGGRTVVGRKAAARIYRQRLAEADDDDNALIFPTHHRDALTELLKSKAADLHVDRRTGFTRNFKSFRPTAISFEILRQTPSPNLLLIARNAGTSVAMIDQFYARRLSAEMGKDVLTANQDDD